MINAIIERAWKLQKETEVISEYHLSEMEYLQSKYSNPDTFLEQLQKIMPSNVYHYLVFPNAKAVVEFTLSCMGKYTTSSIVEAAQIEGEYQEQKIVYTKYVNYDKNGNIEFSFET